MEALLACCSGFSFIGKKGQVYSDKSNLICRLPLRGLWAMRDAQQRLVTSATPVSSTRLEIANICLFEFLQHEDRCVVLDMISLNIDLNHYVVNSHTGFGKCWSPLCSEGGGSDIHGGSTQSC